jgi:hypothetical protein
MERSYASRFTTGTDLSPDELKRTKEKLPPPRARPNEVRTDAEACNTASRPQAQRSLPAGLFFDFVTIFVS